MAEPSLACLLLAAGGSVRLGQSKQLVVWQGEALVKSMARLLLSQSAHVWVVTGAEAGQVGGVLQGEPLKIVRNTQWRNGMGSSIATGMKALDDGFDGVLILLCDQWRIVPRDLDALRRTWASEPSLIAAAHWGEQFGAPSIFPSSLFGDLRRLTGERGAKSLIRQQAVVRLVEMPHAASDLDTPEDLAILERQRAAPR